MRKLELVRVWNVPRRIKFLFYIKWNQLKFRVCGCQLASNARISAKVYISKAANSTIIIGSDFQYLSGDCFNPISRNIRGSFYLEKDAQLNIGNNVGISSSCIYCSEKIVIGNNVKVGANSLIIDTDSHSLNYLYRRNPSMDKTNSRHAPILIEDDVFIGTGVFVLKGVHIGARAIIGAGSVVTHDIPSDSIAAGNPCRVLKSL